MSPEDCGGVWGYLDLLELLKDPEQDVEGRLDWYGPFDPVAFDVAPVDRSLRARFD